MYQRIADEHEKLGKKQREALEITALDGVAKASFLANEDDCSAKNAQLFDPSSQGISDSLGPLSSFRCFEFGIQCDVNDRNKVGPRKNCTPAYDWLRKTQDYVDFFKTLKPAGNVLAVAIAGPTEPVRVGKDGNNPVLLHSCQNGASGFADPGIRIKQFVDGFPESHRAFNDGLPSGTVRGYC